MEEVEADHRARVAQQRAGAHLVGLAAWRSRTPRSARTARAPRRRRRTPRRRTCRRRRRAGARRWPRAGARSGPPAPGRPRRRHRARAPARASPRSRPSRSRARRRTTRPSCDGDRADAARRRCGRRRSRPRRRAPAVRYRCHAVVPWIDQRQRGAVVEPVGDREHTLARVRSRTPRSRRCRPARPRARRCPRARPRPRRRAPAAASPSARRSSCGCACRRSSARARDLDQHLLGPGLGSRQLGQLEHLRARRTRSSGSRASAPRLSECRAPAAGWRRALRCAPMPITVVGSIAYDTVKTPFGERERMLGGAAVHFALAASFFDDVRVVGPVGEDFGEEQLEVMRAPRRGRRPTSSASPGGRDVLLAGRVRLGPELARDARHAARRVRGLRAEALRALALQRRAVPRQHPARAAAQVRAPAARRALRGARLDEPVDRHRPRLARRARSRASTA